MTAQQTKEEEVVFPGRFITLSEIKEILEREQAARAELTYEQKLALEHVTIFTRLSPEQTNELVGKLKEIGGRITEAHAYKLADILPTHADDVRAIFAKDRVTPEPQEIDRIIETVRGYL